VDRATLSFVVDLLRSASDKLGPRVSDLSKEARRRFDTLSARAVGDGFETRVSAVQARYAEPGGDPLGLDLSDVEDTLRLLAIIYRFYFRAEVFGAEHVPDGRALIVANHGGQVPIDGAMVLAALFFDRDGPRWVRAMVDRWVGTQPAIAGFLARLGHVVGSPDVARRLLEREECLLVFPEGVRGVSKPFSRRYQLEDFGAGFARLALETRSPIVPSAVIGSEEQYVSLGNAEWLAKKLRLPSFPLLPQLLVPGGQLPLPARYRLYFGEPILAEGDPANESAVRDLVEAVRQAIAGLLERGLRERKSVFF
jgi:1-acyl-sn-glycerol-3-phosphate acyltransferase